VEVFEEKLARFIILSLQLLTPVEVDIILPAVSGLVLVREPGVEWDGLLQILHFYFRMQENSEII